EYYDNGSIYNTTLGGAPSGSLPARSSLGFGSVPQGLNYLEDIPSSPYEHDELNLVDKETGFQEIDQSAIPGSEHDLTGPTLYNHSEMEASRSGGLHVSGSYYG